MENKLNYKLISNSLNDICNPEKTILQNRGIDNWKKYLSLNGDCIHDYGLLKNINKAVNCVKNHIENKSNIHIIVDSDVDGYTSASMIYRYLKHIDNSMKITYSIHTKKQHGISEDVEIPDLCNLLIVPDAGSNDVLQCKMLSQEQKIDIVILDHHLSDLYMDDDYAIVVNNQLCDYPNKNLCGAGIVYKFLKAMDEELWEDYADELLDMVALGNISDVMDLREFETRYLVDMGLSRIKSKLFKALINKQSYSMSNIVNITNVQFYITPILNALIRVGSQEDKDLLLRAFIETDETFKYKKRGETDEVDEDIYTRAARLCSNAKARQGKSVEKSVFEINEIIKKEKLNNNKILFVNVTDILGETLTGLVAMKIADKYNKPCLLLRKRHDKETYGGSCRNFDNSPVESLKDLLDSTNMFEFVQGHDNAAGVSIHRQNIKQAIEISNIKLNNIDFSKYYMVDFDLDYEDLSISFVKEIDNIKNIFCQGVKEPLIHIKNIPIWKDEILLMGKTKNTWKVTSGQGFSFVKFNVNELTDMVIQSYVDSTGNDLQLGEIDVIGTVSINNYNNILTPQVIVKDYVFRKLN